MHILLVEDEKQIAAFIREGLAAAGITLDLCERGDTGLTQAGQRDYDAIVLDIMLPGRDGLSVLQALRQQQNLTPVILLTARNELGDRIAGLSQGADDYLAKPFYVEELIARLQALVRRGRQNLLEVGDLSLDRLHRQARCRGQEIDLTSREFSLLDYLMRSPGTVFTRARILEHVWGYDFDPSTNVVDVCIKRIRSKIAAITGSEAPSPIEAVRGAGYRFRPAAD